MSVMPNAIDEERKSYVLVRWINGEPHEFVDRLGVAGIHVSHLAQRWIGGRKYLYRGARQVAELTDGCEAKHKWPPSRRAMARGRQR